MISNSWNKVPGESISQKVMGKVKPDAPLKNKIDIAQRKLQFQISKLSSINEKLQKKHDAIFEKIVNAQKNNKPSYAQAYAGELTQVRKMKNMVGGAKLSMEQIKLRLDTVSELGDVVVTLSPCMSIIKGLSPSLSGIMPEANASMQDLSQILGDVMSGSSIGSAGDSFNLDTGASADTMAILEEAQGVIAGQTQETIPDVPEDLKQVAATTSASTIPITTTIPDVPEDLKQVAATTSASTIPITTTIPDVPEDLKQVAATTSATHTRTTIPNIRTGLKHQILETREDIFA